MGDNRKGRDIDAALRRKGFRYDSTGDHLYYFFGDTTIKTKMSHGILGKTVGSPLISQMARQLRLTKSRFLNLVDCSISEEDYRTILHEQNVKV